MNVALRVCLYPVIDGLSIPFFSFGRRVHSRTVSMSRTWTSRHTTGPEWLLGTQRLPGTIRSIGALSSAVNLDPEPGTLSHTDSQNRPDPNPETDAPTISQSAMNHSHIPALGEASVLEDPQDSNDQSLRRRFVSTEDVRNTAPVPAPAEQSNVSQMVSNTGVLLTFCSAI